MRAKVTQGEENLVLVLPEAIVVALGLKPGMMLTVSVEARSIVIRTCGTRPRRPLPEIVAEIDSAAYDRRRKEFPDDGPVGKEIL